MLSLKQEMSNIPSLTLQYNNKRLKMTKTSNYLEWTFKALGGDNTFIITMEDIEIYESFFKLYNDIKLGNIFDEEEVQDIYDNSYSCGLLDINSEVKNTIEYNHLYHEDIIAYKSDSELNDEQVTITKGEDYFKLVFKGSKISNIKKIIFAYPTIKQFKCSKPFIRLFEDLLNTNLEYHQINLYELTKTAI